MSRFLLLSALIAICATSQSPIDECQFKVFANGSQVFACVIGPTGNLFVLTEKMTDIETTEAAARALHTHILEGKPLPPGIPVRGDKVCLIKAILSKTHCAAPAA